MEKEIIYYYDGSFTGFLCCVFDSYVYQEVPTAIVGDEDFLPTLFFSRTIPSHPGHAKRVLDKLRSLSPYAFTLVRRGFLTCDPEKEIHLYRLIRKLLRQGTAFLWDRSDETLYPVIRAVRHLEREAHLLRGFVRFSQFGGVLGGEIEPKNRVLPLLQSHFCGRFQNELFFLYDKTHREALFYGRGKSVIRPLEDFQMAPPDAQEAHYRLLWKRFYDTIAIRERDNPKCRRTQMPQRYWKTMTEFQAPSYFIPQNSPGAVLAPAAPDGKSAPGIPPKSGRSAPESAP